MLCHVTSRPTFEYSRGLPLGAMGASYAPETPKISAVNHDDGRGPFARDPAHGVPALGNGGLGERVEPASVVGRDVHAAGAHQIPPVVMPVRGVESVGAGEILN